MAADDECSCKTHADCKTASDSNKHATVQKQARAPVSRSAEQHEAQASRDPRRILDVFRRHHIMLLLK